MIKFRHISVIDQTIRGILSTGTENIFYLADTLFSKNHFSVSVLSTPILFFNDASEFYRRHLKKNSGDVYFGKGAQIFIDHPL
jgi:hypothetical protein